MANYRNLISKRLAILRQERGLSQQQLADQLRQQGCAFEYMDIVLMEEDRASVTDMELKQLVVFFHTTYEYLLDGKK